MKLRLISANKSTIRERRCAHAAYANNSNSMKTSTKMLICIPLYSRFHTLASVC